MRELLLTRDWSSITLSDVAKAAGISRQTIYNEFGSRQGLAQGYALRLADPLVISLLTGTTKPDLLQLITTDSAPIITRCSARLTQTFMNSWVQIGRASCR